jgi:hypothetical protein
MSSPIRFPPQGFEGLSKAEQLAYLAELENYVELPEDGDIPEWHKKLLDERMAKYEAEGFKGTPWEEFKRELDQELNRKLTEA